MALATPRSPRKPTTNNALAPVVKAADLTQPVNRVTVPEPVVATQPSQFVETLTPAIEQSQQNLITAQTKEADQRNDVLGRLLSNEPTSSQNVFQDTFNNEIERTTGQKAPDFLQQLSDANTNLALLQGKFRTREERILSGGGRGQSEIFANAQLNQLSREEAVQVGNQALYVQALQGNYDSARQIALETANFATQDRQAELTNLLNQFNALDGIVSGQEAQLVEAEKVKVQAEKDALDRLQTNIDAAIVSGEATVQEMQQLTSTQTDDETKLALAQQIQARAARNSVGLDRRIQQAELDNLLLESNPDQTVTTSSGQTYTLAEINTELASLGSQSQTLQDKTNSIDTIINEGLGSAVGTNVFQRTSLIESQSGKRQRVIGNIENLISNEFIDSLISAKEQGATFGALSEAEMNAIISASTKIGQWRMTDDNGKVTGYNIDRQSMIEELNRIKELTNRSIQRSELKELELLEAKESAGAATTAVNLIKNEEGFRDTAYQDQAGVWTIGYGATQIDGRPVQPGDTISRQEAERLLATDIARHSTFRNKVSVPLTPSQEAALQSFEFNLGSGIWDGSGILEAVNQGNFARAGELMKQYTNAGGQPSRGLTMRRNREANLLIG